MRLSGWQLPLEHLSATSLADFISCPEQWRQKRLLKRTDKMFIARFMGAVHHKTLELNFKQKIESKVDLTMDEIIPAYGEQWHEVMLKDGEPEWLQTPAVVGVLGKKMLTAFHTEVSPLVLPVAVEERFEVEVKGVPVPIIGYPDVRQNHSILEMKTAGQKVSKPKPKWRFQARIYQLVHPLRVDWAVTTKQSTPVNYSSLIATHELHQQPGNNDVTALLISQAAEQMNDLYARYGPDSPWPTNGIFGDWTCDYCAFGPKSPNPTCPAWRKNDQAPA